MAELLPINFNIPGESAIASYDYTDISEGTGVVIFDGFVTSDASTFSYRLSKNAILSEVVDPGFAVSGTINIELSPFNIPKTVKGRAYFVFTTYVSASYVDNFIKVIKMSGGVRTELVGGQGLRTAAGSDNHVMSLDIPQTIFKKGDILRIEFSGTLGGAATWAIGLDPLNRVGTYITTPSVTPTYFKAAIPFKLDL
jgi:hypothetical protein